MCSESRDCDIVNKDICLSAALRIIRVVVAGRKSLVFTIQIRKLRNMGLQSVSESAQSLETPYTVVSDAVEYTDESITSYFEYDTVLVSGGKATPQKTPM